MGFFLAGLVAGVAVVRLTKTHELRHDELASAIQKAPELTDGQRDLLVGWCRRYGLAAIHGCQQINSPYAKETLDRFREVLRQ